MIINASVIITPSTLIVEFLKTNVIFSFSKVSLPTIIVYRLTVLNLEYAALQLR